MSVVFVCQMRGYGECGGSSSLCVCVLCLVVDFDILDLGCLLLSCVSCEDVIF